MRSTNSSRLLVFVSLGSLAALGIAAGCGSSSNGATSNSTSSTSASSSSSSAASSSSAGGASSSSAAMSSSSSSMGGAGAGGGLGGAGGSSDPFTTPMNQWTYVAFDNAVCMNGSPTGIGVNLTSNTDNVLIYFQGGNACFNPASCLVTAHPNGFGPSDFMTEESKTIDGMPLFDRTSGALFADYNYIYVPYCTGDIHAGDNDTTVAGQMRHFHGANNVLAYLRRIVPTFPTPKHVIVVGESAGGFGALFNYDRVASAFPAGTDVKLLDDSGPPFAEMYTPACLQKVFYDTWGLGKTLPPGCPDCVAKDGAFEENFTKYLATTYSKNKLALISSTQDATISKFLSYGDMNCANLNGLPESYPGSEYQMGLEDLRDRILKGQPNFKMFLFDGTDGSDDTQHVWLNGDWTMESSNGVALSDWLNQLVTDDPAWDNVPMGM